MVWAKWRHNTFIVEAPAYTEVTTVLNGYCVYDCIELTQSKCLQWCSEQKVQRLSTLKQWFHAACNPDHSVYPTALMIVKCVYDFFYLVHITINEWCTVCRHVRCTVVYIHQCSAWLARQTVVLCFSCRSWCIATECCVHKMILYMLGVLCAMSGTVACSGGTR